jgi:predicted transglutaminase-like cysteine proteinase
MTATLLATVALAATAIGSGSADASSRKDRASTADRGSALVERRPALAPLSQVVFCKQYPDDCAPTSAGAERVRLDDDRLAELDRVNRAVNRAIRPVPESGRGLAADRWVIAPKKGDCDDFAVTKRHRLIAAGWDASVLRIAVARTVEGEGHAVLVVRTHRGDMVLDNRTDRILGWKATGLRFVKMQSGLHPRLWSEI